MITSANGKAVTIMMDCSPCSAVAPPTTKSAAATPPSSTPQVMVTHEDGSGFPR